MAAPAPGCRAFRPRVVWWEGGTCAAAPGAACAAVMPETAQQHCSRCGQDLPVDAFPPSSVDAGGWCRACKTAHQRERRAGNARGARRGKATAVPIPGDLADPDVAARWLGRLAGASSRGDIPPPVVRAGGALCRAVARELRYQGDVAMVGEFVALVAAWLVRRSHRAGGEGLDQAAAESMVRQAWGAAIGAAIKPADDIRMPAARLELLREAAAELAAGRSTAARALAAVDACKAARDAASWERWGVIMRRLKQQAPALLKGAGWTHQQAREWLAGFTEETDQ